MNSSVRRRAAAALATTMVLGFGAVAVASAAPAGPAPVTDPLAYVDPFVGTGQAQGVVGEINNFPGPSMPYGMVQLSPDTPGAYAGYRYSHDRIRGFSSTHAAAGCNIFGDLPILPVAGDASSRPWDRTERFSHDQESAEVGSYDVTLLDSDIDVELSASTRAGGIAMDFPDTDQDATVIVNAGGSLSSVAGASIDVSGEATVSGSVTTGRFCGKNNTQTLYYSIEFSQPFTSFATWQGDEVRQGARNANDARSGATLSFPPGSTVDATIGLSYVDVAGAAANREAEIPDFDYERTRERTRAAWTAELEKISVASANQDDLTMFYTSLYHSLLHPNTFNDVDGRYIGFDGEIRTVEEGRTHYANFSDWDTYRSLGALQAILDPDRASDMAQSLVAAAEQSGWLPRWPLANQHTGQMTGDSSVPLIASMLAFGADDFDVDTALDYMVKGATSSAPTATGYVQRRGIETYLEKRYAPHVEAHRGDHGINGASITQEWSIADFAIAEVAESVGRTDVAQTFRPRSQYWQNVFDPAQDTVAARNLDGTFIHPDVSTGFGQSGFDEGNSEQYLWLVPQNVAGLVETLGGPDRVADRLDAFTTTFNSGSNAPRLWIGNEPNFGVPWLYNYIGQSWRTSELVDDIVAELFRPEPDGKPGNDDLGAQAGWYVWAALGLYPSTPGTDVLTINTPRFDSTSITLANGEKLVVNAPGASTGMRQIAGMSVDGQPWSSTSLPPDLIHEGGTIDFTLAPEPSAWARAATAPPSSRDGEQDFIASLDSPAITLAPGERVTTTVSTRSRGGAPRDFSVSAAPHDGISIETAAVDPATGDVPVTIVADVDAPDGYRDITLTVTAAGSTHVIDVTGRALVTRPGGVLATYNTVGTADESDRGVGNFDRVGNSYSRQQLALVGLTPGSRHNLGDLTFEWPQSPHGRPDTIRTDGQTLTLATPSRSIAFVGAATNGRQSGDVVLTHADGSTSVQQLVLGDWIYPTGEGSVSPIAENVVVAKMGKRNGDRDQVFVFGTKPITAPDGTLITRITLPKNPDLLVFAVAQSDDVVAVTPQPVTFTDASGTTPGTYSIPQQTGVEYLRDGVVVEPGTYPGQGTVTVTARATTGHVLAADAVAQWSHTFESTTPDAPFVDVAAGTLFGDDIAWLFDNEISTGWDNGDGTHSFRPLQPIARDAMAAFLYRQANSPAFTPPTVSPFRDVAPGDQFYKEIAWLAEQRISTGWDNGDSTASFRPLEPVNRDAMAAFLHRMAGRPAFGAPSVSPFTDMTPSTKFYTEVTWLVSEGIATGWVGNDLTAVYQPTVPINRDAMAAFLHRFDDAGFSSVGS